MILHHISINMELNITHLLKLNRDDSLSDTDISTFNHLSERLISSKYIPPNQCWAIGQLDVLDICPKPVQNLSKTKTFFSLDRFWTDHMTKNLI
jgi:hypothetical protein